MNVGLDINLETLKSFAVFAESMNFTRAAEQLHISQPSLHVKIRKLGEQLGATLYVKRGRSLHLTNKGREVARFAREESARIESFVSNLSGVGPEESVTLSAGRGSFLYLLGKPIEKFKRQSGAKLRLMVGSQDDTLNHVRTGQAHFGVTVLREQPDDLICKRLVATPAKLVVPDTHRLARRSSVRLTHLKNLELIVPPEGRSHRTMIATMLEAKQIPWEVAVEADGWELAIHFVSLGIGVAIVNGNCLLPKGVAGIPLTDFPGTNYYVVKAKGAKIPSAASKLLQLIRDRT